jgi:hypothetical protein
MPLASLAYSCRCRSSQPVVCSSRSTTRTGFVHEFEDGERDEGLGGRTDAEEGVGGGRLIGGDVRFAEAGDPVIDLLWTIAVDDSDGQAGGVGVVEDFFELLTQLGDRLRWFGLGLRFFLGNEACG